MSNPVMTDIATGILAGGQSLRFGDQDKAAALLAGVPIISHVAARLGPQSSELMISGPSDFGSGLPYIPDDPDGIDGPVAGLLALAKAFQGKSAFLTVAVDMPFIPLDYARCMVAKGPTAIASVKGNLHPTCGLWNPKKVIRLIAKHDLRENLSLRGAAKLCGYRACEFTDKDAFMNINSAQDMKAAMQKMEKAGG